jgi:hypothetical protein
LLILNAAKIKGENSSIEAHLSVPSPLVCTTPAEPQRISEITPRCAELHRSNPGSGAMFVVALQLLSTGRTPRVTAFNRLGPQFVFVGTSMGTSILALHFKLQCHQQAVKRSFQNHVHKFTRTHFIVAPEQNLESS